MNRRTLGRDLHVSPVGLGCMGFSHGYGEATDEKEAVRRIREAYDMGYTFFDRYIRVLSVVPARAGVILLHNGHIHSGNCGSRASGGF